MVLHFVEVQFEVASIFKNLTTSYLASYRKLASFNSSPSGLSIIPEWSHVAQGTGRGRAVSQAESPRGPLQ